MIGEAIWAMATEGFNVLIRLRMRDSLLRFDSPCDCHSSLVLGISHCGSDPKASVQPCMDAVPLLIRIEIKSCQSSGYEVVLIEIGFNSSIDNRVDVSVSVSIRARSGCTNILEANMLIKCLGKFVLGSLL